MKKWANLLLLALGIIFILIIIFSGMTNFLLSSQTESFDSIHSNVLDLFNKYGVDLSNGITDQVLEKLSKFGTTKLDALGNEIGQIQTLANSPQNGLIEIYKKTLNLEKQEISLENLNKELAQIPVDDICSSMARFQERSASSGRAVELTKELNSKINSFVSNFQEENQKAKFKADYFDIQKLEQRQSALQNSFAIMLESCGRA